MPVAHKTGGAAKRRLSREEGLYWTLWGRVCAAQGYAHRDTEKRREIHLRAGVPTSHGEFSHAHYDRVFAEMKLLVSDVNLTAAIESVGYENHDAARATHQPVIKSGRKYTLKNRRRQWASKYEKIPKVNDPGEHRRLVYVINRLFEQPLIEKLVLDICHTRRDWRDLPLDQLTLLRDALKSRLGKWLTGVKNGAPGIDQLRGIPLCDMITGRPSSNEALIKALLKRGLPVRMERERQDILGLE